jgi:hypothetical protein
VGYRIGDENMINKKTKKETRRIRKAGEENELEKEVTGKEYEIDKTRGKIIVVHMSFFSCFESNHFCP